MIFSRGPGKFGQKIIVMETIILKPLQHRGRKALIFILRTAQNDDHASGLRMSEITTLETKDPGEDRRLLLIRKAKGEKDRIASLSPVMLVLLRDYQLAYKPGKYLFEGQNKGTAYSSGSLELIIKAKKDKAGISKTDSMHLLRHSFATHLGRKEQISGILRIYRVILI